LALIAADQVVDLDQALATLKEIPKWPEDFLASADAVEYLNSRKHVTRGESNRGVHASMILQVKLILDAMINR